MSEYEQSSAESEEEKIELAVKTFEDGAKDIYIANVSMVGLEIIEKNASLISEPQRNRLFEACEEGMKINPNGSKEHHQFVDFKQRLTDLFTEKSGE